MLNGVQIIGRAYDIDTKTYPDGAEIVHFTLAYPRATRTDQFTCRMIRRKGTGLALARTPAEGETVAIAGTLTTLGAEGQRVCIDVRGISTPESWRA